MTKSAQSYAIVAAVSLVAAAGAWVYFKGLKGAAKDTVNAAGNVAAGVVEGIGEQIGIPSTDVDKCALAMSQNKALDVSLYCPAGTFLRWIAAGRPPSFAKQLVGNEEARNRPDLGFSRYQPGDM